MILMSDMDDINKITLDFYKKNIWPNMIEHLGHDIRVCNICLVNYIETMSYANNE